MEIMERVYLHLLLLLVTLIQGIQGQAVTPSAVDVAVGDDVSLECITTTTRDPFQFQWDHITPTETVTVYGGGIKGPPDGQYENFDLDEDITLKRSTLIINSIMLQDAGQYECSASGQTDIPLATVNVEEGSVPAGMELNITVDNSNAMYMYQATCDAIGSSPEETITWILDGVTQTDVIVETDPDISADPLFDKRSVFTFLSTPDNYNVTLVCEISGHQVARFNRQETRLVNIHKPPQPGDILIDLTINGTELTISCDDTNSEAVPAMSTLNIYSGETLITKPDSDKAVTVTEPEQRTKFTCEGSNYLGTTMTSQFYGSTPAPPPTTAQETTTTTPVVNDKNSGATSGLGAGAYAGIAIGVIACIVIIVLIVLYLLKPECCPCFAGSGIKSSGSSKPAGSAVGSSNGSEREKTKPEAAPRGHGSIQHTNDNPNQDMYAMVDKKPSGGRGGDAPDRGSGPGQNEPQGMLYADLDLSHKAGHTDKHVPKNENDVVVYSSILV